MHLNAGRSTAALALALATVVPASAGIVPYKVHKKTLANGLDVLVVPMPEFKGVLSMNMLVLAGSRNEVDKGKSGLAHLFEHILFRHRHGGKDGGYSTEIDRMGAHNNAFTSFDVTYYHPFTFTSNLDKLFELEAGRFVSLDFGGEKVFKTEAGAVLGEYRRNSSNPGLRVSEVLLGLAFKEHPYGHTTLGYLEDVQDMPNEYKAALAFYDAYYRPGSCVLVVAGDVDVAGIFARAEKHFGPWAAKAAAASIPKEPMQSEARRGAVPWEADVAPRVTIAHKVPAFVPGSSGAAAGQIVPELLFSESAPLYQKLRYQDKTVAALDHQGGDEYQSFDPRLFVVQAVLFKDQLKAKGPAYIESVEKDILAGMEGLAQFSKTPGAQQTLDVLKSKYRYDTLAALGSPATFAESLALVYRFTRDPEVLDRMLEAVDRLTPEDIDAYARAHFAKEGRTVVTLESKPQPGGGQ